MRKYAKVVDDVTKKCDVGLGDDVEYYESLGFIEQDVEQAYNNQWYLEGYAPSITDEEQKENRRIAYVEEVDCITAHIQRLRDMEQTLEIIDEINALKIERDEKVQEIKRRYPYSGE